MVKLNLIVQQQINRVTKNVTIHSNVLAILQNPINEIKLHFPVMIDNNIQMFGVSYST